MKMKKLSLIMAVLLVSGCGGSSGTGNVSSSSGAQSVMLNGSTVADAAIDSSQFLKNAYQDGLGEIQLSQLALQKAVNNDVKKFAQRMIDDHTRMNNDIKQLAQSKNIALPTDLSSEQKTQSDKLASLSGEEFDRAYMSFNVDGHEKDVAAARVQAQKGTDPDVKALAQTSLPILELHLAVAEEINGLLDPSAFLVSAYQDGLAEIQLSRLAGQKATSDEVKRFAQRMIDDHTEANKNIAAVAQKKGVTLPSSVSQEQQTAADELTRFTGADFDKAYMDKNVVAHVKDVRAARQQSDQGRATDVKTLAQQALPVLASHLATAIDIDSRLDPSFLYSAIQNGNEEIQLAKLALSQGSSDQVKAFAQRMITDHTAANQQIQQLAKERNVPLPTELSPEQVRALVNLLGKSGSDFDRAYMDFNVQGHKNAVAEATEQAQDPADAGLQSFARNTLPVLTEHLMQAKQIQLQLAPAQPAGT